MFQDEVYKKAEASRTNSKTIKQFCVRERAVRQVVFPPLPRPLLPTFRPAYLLVQLKRYPFDVLARRISHQSTQIDFAPFQLLYSLKGWLKQVNVVHHFVQKPLNILLGQIAFWRRVFGQTRGGRKCYAG